jgi:hypothetical protein
MADKHPDLEQHFHDGYKAPYFVNKKTRKSFWTAEEALVSVTGEAPQAAQQQKKQEQEHQPVVAREEAIPDYITATFHAEYKRDYYVNTRSGKSGWTVAELLTGDDPGARTGAMPSAAAAASAAIAATTRTAPKQEKDEMLRAQMGAFGKSSAAKARAGSTMGQRRRSSISRNKAAASAVGGEDIFVQDAGAGGDSIGSGSNPAFRHRPPPPAAAGPGGRGGAAPASGQHGTGEADEPAPGTVAELIARARANGYGAGAGACGGGGGAEPPALALARPVSARELLQQQKEQERAAGVGSTVAAGAKPRGGRRISMTADGKMWVTVNMERARKQLEHERESEIESEIECECESRRHKTPGAARARRAPCAACVRAAARLSYACGLTRHRHRHPPPSAPRQCSRAALARGSQMNRFFEQEKPTAAAAAAPALGRGAAGAFASVAFRPRNDSAGGAAAASGAGTAGMSKWRRLSSTSAAAGAFGHAGAK